MSQNVTKCHKKANYFLSANHTRHLANRLKLDTALEHHGHIYVSSGSAIPPTPEHFLVLVAFETRLVLERSQIAPRIVRVFPNVVRSVPAAFSEHSRTTHDSKTNEGR